MSQAAVLAVVETKCRALAGVDEVYPYGAPDGGVPLTGIPCMVINIMDGTIKPLTMGSAGKMEQRYEIRLTLYLGQPQSTEQEVRERAITYGYAESVLSSFDGDWTLLDQDDAGTCFLAGLEEVGNNFDTFRSEGAFARMQWRLFVTEHRAANA